MPGFCFEKRQRLQRALVVSLGSSHPCDNAGLILRNLPIVLFPCLHSSLDPLDHADLLGYPHTYCV